MCVRARAGVADANPQPSPVTALEELARHGDWHERKSDSDADSVSENSEPEEAILPAVRRSWSLGCQRVRERERAADALSSGRQPAGGSKRKQSEFLIDPRVRPAVAPASASASSRWPLSRAPQKARRRFVRDEA